MDTITAIATGFPAAIATIRLSGKDTVRLLNDCFFSNEKLSPRRLRLGKLIVGNLTDRATAVFFKSPQSFTGEDMAEITFHANPILAKNILQQLINKGARLAEAGEFSKRAFLNGKMDLSSAEGILNLINAESESELLNAYSLLSGRVCEKIKELQEEIRSVAAALEAALDFPEEEIDEPRVIAVAIELRRLGKKAASIAGTYDSGRLIKNGIRLAIIGGVNVGKSSLLNALINKDRAIVTDVPGTTRDTLEDRFEFNGHKFIITDTAGIRSDAGKVEAIGISRAIRAAEQSDLILAVAEAGRDYPAEVKDLLATIEKDKIIYIQNKTDILEPTGRGCAISAKTGQGIDALKQHLCKICFSEGSVAQNKPEQGIVLTELRHYNAVKDTADVLLSSAEEIFVTPPDCLAADLKYAYNLLGSITGESGSEAIIDEIFSRFCVGK